MRAEEAPAPPPEAAELAALRAEWIPVTERLPETHTRVMVYRPGCGVDTVAIVTYRQHAGFSCTVTHWRPLPSPPGSSASPGAEQEAEEARRGWDRMAARVRVLEGDGD